MSTKDEISVIEKHRTDLVAYTIWKVYPADTMRNLPAEVKLQILQFTPEKALKTRKVWSVTIPYLDIGYIERALNFLDPYWSCEVIGQPMYKEYTRKKTIKRDWKEVEVDQKVFDASVFVRFTIHIGNNILTRTTNGSWQMFENAATSDYSVIQACISQATKSFADTLWIWSDKMELEKAWLQKARLERERAIVNWVASADHYEESEDVDWPADISDFINPEDFQQ